MKEHTSQSGLTTDFSPPMFERVDPPFPNEINESNVSLKEVWYLIFCRRSMCTVMSEVFSGVLLYILFLK